MDRSVRRTEVIPGLFEGIGDLTLQAFDALFPRREPFKPVVLAPRQLPVSPPEGFLIGQAFESGKEIYASSPQLDRHLLIVGATGCGKTTFIARLFTEEILKWQ